MPQPARFLSWQHLPFWLLVVWALGTWLWTKNWLGESRHPLAFHWALSFSTALAVVGPLVLIPWILCKQLERRWPRTLGVVAAANVRIVSRTKGRRTLQAELTVDYSIEGISHRAVCVQHVLGRVGTDSLLRAHPVGSAVTVYHHPRRHERAEIAPGLPGWVVVVLLILGIGVPWTITAVLWVVKFQ
jgi:hypothetical protein